MTPEEIAAQFDATDLSDIGFEDIGRSLYFKHDAGNVAIGVYKGSVVRDGKFGEQTSYQVETAEGPVLVDGRAILDRKMAEVEVGDVVRIECTDQFAGRARVYKVGVKRAL